MNLWQAIHALMINPSIHAMVIFLMIHKYSNGILELFWSKRTTPSHGCFVMPWQWYCLAFLTMQNIKRLHARHHHLTSHKWFTANESMPWWILLWNYTAVVYQVSFIKHYMRVGCKISISMLVIQNITLDNLKNTSNVFLIVELICHFILYNNSLCWMMPLIIQS